MALHAQVRLPFFNIHAPCGIKSQLTQLNLPEVLRPKRHG